MEICETVSMYSYGEKQGWSLAPFPYVEVQIPYKKNWETLKIYISKTKLNKTLSKDFPHWYL